MICFCGVSDDVQAVSVLRLSLVSVLICHEHLCKGMAYTFLVFTDNQAGKHKDRRKNSVDAKAVSSRTSEGEWQMDCVGLERRTLPPQLGFLVVTHCAFTRGAGPTPPST